MLNIPQYSKYRKYQKGNLKNNVLGNYTLKSVSKGICLKTISAGRIDIKQLNTFRQSLNKTLKRVSQINTHIYPNTPITKKPSGIRMGKGKGATDKWVSNVSSSKLLFQIEGGLNSIIILALKQIQKKISIKTKIVYEL